MTWPREEVPLEQSQAFAESWVFLAEPASAMNNKWQDILRKALRQISDDPLATRRLVPVLVSDQEARRLPGILGSLAVLWWRADRRLDPGALALQLFSHLDVEPLAQERAAPVNEPTHADVVLSYASEDHDQVELLRRAIEQAGLSVFADVGALQTGQLWEAQIEEAIRHCKIFVPVISPATDARPVGLFRREWTLAHRRAQAFAPNVRFLWPVVVGQHEQGASPAQHVVPPAFREYRWAFVQNEEDRQDLASQMREERRRRLVPQGT